MTAPHIGNTGVNAEDDESRRIWLGRLRGPRPGPAAVQLARHRRAWTTAGRRGRGRDRRDRHPRADPAPAGAGGHAGGHLQPRPRPGDGCCERVLASPTMLGADLSRRGDHAASRTPSPAEGEHRLHGRRARPRHQAQRRRGAWPPAASTTHVLPASSTPEDLLAVGPDAVFLSNGPGDPATADHAVTLAREVLRRGLPLFGICFGNQILGRALGFGTYKLALRPPRASTSRCSTWPPARCEVTCHNHGFAVDAPLRPGGRHRLRRGRGQSHVCLNDGVVEGLRLPGRAGVLGAVPPRGGGRPARRRLPVRPVRRADGARGSRPVPKRTDLSPRPGDRLRADRHRAGLRVRLLGHPGVPGAAGRGAAGQPGQLEPGDDHDRPRVRRRHLRRADHPGVRARR